MTTTNDDTVNTAFKRIKYEYWLYASGAPYRYDPHVWWIVIARYPA